MLVAMRAANTATDVYQDAAQGTLDGSAAVQTISER
jgi:hypothetical protein